MTSTPPPFDPFSAPAPEPPPPAARRWRWVVAGATAGAVLAVSAAIPLTWAARDTIPFLVAEGQQQTGTDDGTDEDRRAEQLPWIGDREATVPSDSTSTDATDDQSRGVVLIDTEVLDGAGAGTGLVLSDDGLVLTNYHVVDGSSEITATVASTGETYSGRVVGYDDVADVALVQLDDASDLDTATIDDDGDDDETGDEVTAIGNARGQGSLSAVSGTITATEQAITTSPPHAESLSGLLQTNAAAVPGYSGGPMVDDEGEVIGITTAASSSGASDSYAVPIEDAIAVVQQIAAGEEEGDVHVGPPAYLGVTVSEDTGTVEGLPIAEVAPDSPAAEAGIAAGDLITAVGDAPVGEVSDLLGALGQLDPGDSVEIAWTHDGEQRNGP